MEDSADHPCPALMTITELVPSSGMHQSVGPVGDMQPEHVETVVGDNYS